MSGADYHRDSKSDDQQQSKHHSTIPCLFCTPPVCLCAFHTPNSCHASWDNIRSGLESGLGSYPHPEKTYSSSKTLRKKSLQRLSTAHTRLVTKHCDDRKSQSLSIHTDCDARIHPPYDSTKCQTNALFNVGAPPAQKQWQHCSSCFYSSSSEYKETKRPIKR